MAMRPWEVAVRPSTALHRDPSLPGGGVDLGVRHPHMSSRSLGLEHGSGPLWNFHELMLHGPAAGLLGCRSAGRWLCGHWRHRKKGQQQGVVGILKTANSRMKVVTFFPHWPSPVKAIAHSPHTVVRSHLQGSGSQGTGERSDVHHCVGYSLGPNERAVSGQACSTHELWAPREVGHRQLMLSTWVDTSNGPVRHQSPTPTGTPQSHHHNLLHSMLTKAVGEGSAQLPLCQFQEG